MLDYNNSGTSSSPWGPADWASWYWKNRISKGSLETTWAVLCRLQLLRADYSSDNDKTLLRSDPAGRLGLPGRVQPNRHRSSERDRLIPLQDQNCPLLEAEIVSFRWLEHQNQTIVWHFHHDESRL